MHVAPSNAIPLKCIAALIAFAAAIAAPASDFVYVTLDMDPSAPGRQHSIVALPGSASRPATVSISDPSESHAIYNIGYLGGLDRGIAFGHVIRNANHGTIAGLATTPGTAANPDNHAYPFPAIPGAKAFSGPEVQYVEWGASQPGLLRADAPPIFRVTIQYRDALPCDTFDFYLADFVRIWRDFPGFPPAGAFSTSGFTTLDTGGDAIADATDTLAGIDADSVVPVPPAAFLVDYVDGPPGGGPATLRITWPGDLDGDREVDLSDLTTLLSHFGVASGAVYSDGDIDGDGQVELNDLATLLGFFGSRCQNG